MLFIHMDVWEKTKRSECLVDVFYTMTFHWRWHRMCEDLKVLCITASDINLAPKSHCDTQYRTCIVHLNAIHRFLYHMNLPHNKFALNDFLLICVCIFVYCVVGRLTEAFISFRHWHPKRRTHVMSISMLCWNNAKFTTETRKLMVLVSQ